MRKGFMTTPSQNLQNDPKTTDQNTKLDGERAQERAEVFAGAPQASSAATSAPKGSIFARAKRDR